ncbi:hypothetical protein [Bacillus sp. FJAT-45350]|uniref:hypothetical protein n=1 Tax=Bacillus sp. FJAT-45350 TaxID=2011014 RepID=UPI000BB7F1C6|nr:hypothetical protein [Bacillus sp. FJAT-45350]
MILAYKFKVLSDILEIYKVNNNGKIVFNRDHFESSTPYPDSTRYLHELIEDGIVHINGDVFTINTYTWISLFVKELNKLFRSNQIGFYCEFKEKDKLLHFIKKESETVSIYFEINFDPHPETKESNIIHFCKLYTFEFNIFWLDLVNDNNNFLMFCSYLNNEFDKLTFDERIKFLFLNDLKSGDVSQVFNSIKNYIKEKFNSRDITLEENRLIKKLLRIDNFEVESFSIDDCSLLIIRYDSNLEIISLKEGRIHYSENVKKEINILKNKLENKVLEYRRFIFLNEANFFRNTQSMFRLILTILTVIVTPINIIILAFNIDNLLIKTIISIIMIISLFGIIVWVIVPMIRMFSFKWKIKVK